MQNKDLRKLLAQYDPNAEVLIPAADHSYRTAHVNLGTVLEEAPRQYTEDHGEAITPESTCGKRIYAIIVS